VDVDLETDNNRQTPLITACLMGNYEIVRLLLLAKAEVNKPNLLNQIPLTVILFRLVEEPASFENKKICFLIADLLIKYGADLNWIIDKKNGFSLLHYFCSLKMKMNKPQKQLNYDIVKYLLERGADYTMLTLGDRSC
jgi:ankyrin repeat protein